MKTLDCKPWENVGSNEGFCSLFCFLDVRDLNIFKSQCRDLLVVGGEVEYMWERKDNG